MILMSYFPKYEMLDEIKDESKTINIYIDLKNCLSGLYNKHALEESFYYMKDGIFESNEILLSFLNFMKFHYEYMYSRKQKMRFFIFTEIGKSLYHLRIDKDYKKNRTISTIKTLSAFENDTIKKIIKSNIEKILKAGDFLYNSHSVCFQHLEADAVPYYIIKNHFNNEDNINVIYSNDSDMLQCLKFENTYIYVRKQTIEKKFYNKLNWHETLKDVSNKLLVDNYEYFKAMVGDKSDGVKGVSGVGPKKALSFLENINKPISDVSEIKNLIEKDPLSKTVLKNWNEFIKSYKLVSFEEIINHIDLENKNLLRKTLKKPKLSFIKSIKFINDARLKIGGV